MAMSSLFSAYFWRSTAERAVKSFAQALLAVLGATQAGILDISWVPALSTAAMAGVLSVLTSIGSAKVGPPDDPSLIKPEAPANQPVASPQPREAAAVA
jgi:Putative lactococcus lactis phage r1t holin